jgi:microtubule-associated protein-like 6
MAVHPEGHTVATGEIGAYPKIVLWDANTGVSIRIIKFHKRGVSQLAFSGSGTMLVSCGMDNDRLIAVHNISTGSLVGTGKAGRGVDIFCIAVYSDNVFCTAGRNHIKFWEFPAPTSPGGEMSSKGGIFNNKGVISRVVTTVAYLGTDAVTGMYDGSLLLWKERTCARSRDSVHKGPVSAMCAMPVSGGSTTDKSDSGPQIISGGKDGMIYVWTAQLESIWKLDINLAEPRPLLPEVQALAFRENKVLVGTRSSDIYEFNRLNQSESRLLVTGHHLDKAEVWGLATHPDQPKIITCGDDMTVRLWSTKTNSQLQILQLGVKARACAFSRDGSHIAIGTYDGRVKIVSEDLVAEYADVAVAKSWIQVLQFSPHSDFLAVGGHDNIVYIMDTTTFSIRGKGKGHTSFIQAIDFSVDSTKLQSCSGNHEMKFWDVDGNEIVKNSDTRDIQWSTYTCTIGWPVQGCWADCDEDGGEVNSVDRSPDGQYVVTGCDNKRVNLYAYPCTKDEAKFISSKGHSEHITKVRYTFDGKSIISIGGLDKTILKFDLKS